MTKKILPFSLLLRKGLNAVLFLIPVCLTLACCSSNDREPSYLENPDLEDEEYEVYTAIIKNEYIYENTELVIISEDIEPFRIYDNEEDSLAGMYGVLKKGDTLVGFGKKLYIDEIGSDTFRDFEKKCMQVFPLEYKFNLNIRYLFLKRGYKNYYEEETEPIRNFWSEFYLLYPGSAGIISFSRVGCNNNQTRALVYFGYSFGSLSGLGGLLYLEKIKGTWIKKNGITIWIS